MSKVSCLETLEKMLNYYNEILVFTKDYDIIRFNSDLKTVRAVTNNILQIGELSKKLDADFKNKHSAVINWDYLRLTRNLIAHDSENISHKRLWDTAKYDLSQVNGVLMVLYHDLNVSLNQTAVKPKVVKPNTANNTKNKPKSKNISKTNNAKPKSRQSNRSDDVYRCSNGTVTRRNVWQY